MTQTRREHVLAVQQVSKRFPAVQALASVTLAFNGGEVHGIVGENGAGKSTLMNILAGVHQPTSGQVLLEGQPVRFSQPADAVRHGIAMIHQELNLVDELSVADNVFLGRELSRFGWINARETRRRAREILASFDYPIDPGRKVRHLSIAEKQMVEIAKALSCEARIIIMDEPTAVLTRREVKLLFKLISRLKQRGVTVIYISHILPEVLEISDRITVMRDGSVVQTLLREDVGEEKDAEERLASLMVGREMSQHFPDRGEFGRSVALRVEGLSVPDAVHNVSFEVRRGEILGFAGLIGAGRTEMAEAIVGLRRASEGQVLLDDQKLRIRTVRDARRHGIAYLSEDRRERGLVMGMNITHNTTLVSLRKYCHPFIASSEERAATRIRVDQLNIRISSVRDPIQTLSGGNQQKVAIAKWLEVQPKVLILDEPTRGVDIGAKEEIYRLIKQLAGKGMACILISSELNELLGMCHRIAVMRNGRIASVFDGASATEEQIMYHAAGVAGAATA